MENDNLQDERINKLVERLEYIKNIKDDSLRDKLLYEIDELIELETGPGTKGDRYFKQILRRILRYGTLDQDPRPVWRDEYENASYYEKVITKKDKVDKVIRVVRTEDGQEFELDPSYGVEVGKYINRNGEHYGVVVNVPAHTLSINHVMTTYDLSKGESPLCTLRYAATKNSVSEIFWIYVDGSNDLVDFDKLMGKDTWDTMNKISNWWEEWALRNEDGSYKLNEAGHPNIGACYGGTTGPRDMYNKLIEGILKDPDGRRHIMCMWQVDDFAQAHGLKPCAFLTNWNIRHEADGDYLDMCLYQRSSDFVTAGCINQAQYVILMELVARELTGRGLKVKPGKFSWMVDNIQIYDRHIPIAEELLKREPIDIHPEVVFKTEATKAADIRPDDITIKGYNDIREKIKAKNPDMKIPVAV